jgi:negative regulator of sigma E activity
MDHNRHQEQISQFIDNELAENDSPALFAHLSTCKECREFLQESMGLRTGILEKRLAFPTVVDENIRRRLSFLSRFGEHEGLAFFNRLRETRIRLSLLSAAAVILVLITGGTLYSIFTPSETKNAPETQIICLKTLPEIEVRAYYPAPGSSEKKGNRQ